MCGPRHDLSQDKRAEDAAHVSTSALDTTFTALQNQGAWVDVLADSCKHLSPPATKMSLLLAISL